MKQTNLSVFIPHLGCPNTCSFCNQRCISGSITAPSADEVKKLLSEQQPVLKAHKQSAEIAFFGGSFTAVDEEYRNSLLEAAQSFIEAFPQEYCGIRCSTRPDCISEKTLLKLKKSGVTAVELGAQSMNDSVLALNKRGHTAEDVRKASRLIKNFGFELGLQMMTGLLGDKPEYCIDTAREFIELKPKTVRIYPTVILQNTELARLFESGEYRSFGFEETVGLCAELLRMFRKNDIKVIRLGLHASETVEGEMLGGVYHPALGEIVESRIVLAKMQEQMKPDSNYIIFTDKKYISRIIGHKSANKAALQATGIRFQIKEEKGTFLRIEEV